MVLNKSGQQMWGIGIVFACFVILAAFIMIVPLSSLIDTARIDLDCNNTSISMGEKITCLGIDLYLPYFILIALFALLAYVIWKGAS
jgi:uncharacterized membrane protein